MSNDDRSHWKYVVGAIDSRISTLGRGGSELGDETDSGRRQIDSPPGLSVGQSAEYYNSIELYVCIPLLNRQTCVCHLFRSAWFVSRHSPSRVDLSLQSRLIVVKPDGSPIGFPTVDNRREQAAIRSREAFIYSVQSFIDSYDKIGGKENERKKECSDAADRKNIISLCVAPSTTQCYQAAN